MVGNSIGALWLGWAIGQILTPSRGSCRRLLPTQLCEEREGVVRASYSVCPWPDLLELSAALGAPGGPGPGSSS